jgi:hypothetical protein
VVAAGKAAWKLDDPVVLAAERAERLAAAADAARRKLANALDKKVRHGVGRGVGCSVGGGREGVQGICWHSMLDLCHSLANGGHCHLF